MSVPAPSRPSRALRSLPIVLAGMTFLLFVTGRDPRALGPVLVVAAVLFVPVVVGRWRMRRLLVSGDVERVIGTWEGTITRIAHAETMAPLLRATAYAAYGWLEPARRAMERWSRARPGMQPSSSGSSWRRCSTPSTVTGRTR